MNLKYCAYKPSVLLVLALLGACSSLQVPPLVERVSIEHSDRTKTVKYSGKGAGASAMLMSSMGPMGVAVGIAIDEGIGKDIHTGFSEAGGDIGQLMHTAVSDGLTKACLSKQADLGQVCNRDVQILVRLQRIALKAAPGDSDLVVADVSFNIHFTGITKAFTSREADVCNEKREILDAVKLNGALTSALLSDCVKNLVSTYK